MENILFNNQYDDIEENNEYNINIYVKQRNARKCITTIQGLSSNKIILKNYSKKLRKILNCSCSIAKDDDNYFLKLSSKDVDKIISYLVNILEISKDNIKVHGS